MIGTGQLLVDASLSPQTGKHVPVVLVTLLCLTECIPVVMYRRDFTYGLVHKPMLIVPAGCCGDKCLTD
jgi:hypothetical protein